MQDRILAYVTEPDVAPARKGWLRAAFLNPMGSDVKWEIERANGSWMAPPRSLGTHITEAYTSQQETAALDGVGTVDLKEFTIKLGGSRRRIRASHAGRVLVAHRPDRVGSIGGHDMRTARRKDSQRCPAGHELVEGTGGGWCDRCDGAQERLLPMGSTLYGCRACNYDECHSCYAGNGDWFTYGVDTVSDAYEMIPLPGFNAVSGTTGASVPVWQSRTRFSADDPWHNYTAEDAAKLEVAYKAGGEAVELSMKGKTFVVHTGKMRQHRKGSESTRRDVRRSDEAAMQWYSVALSVPYDCAAFDAEANQAIENGSDRVSIGGVQLTKTLSSGGSGNAALVDKASRRYYRTGKAPLPDLYRALVSIPAPLAQILETRGGPDGRFSGHLPRASPMFKVLEDRFEATKWSTEKGVSHADLKIEKISYTFTREQYMHFQRKLEHPENVKLAFHGTGKPAAIDAISRDNFSMKLIGAGTGNEGWFGKGIYFSERSFTALGYNRGTKLIASVLAVNNVSLNWSIPFVRARQT